MSSWRLSSSILFVYLFVFGAKVMKRCSKNKSIPGHQPSHYQTAVSREIMIKVSLQNCSEATWESGCVDQSEMVFYTQGLVWMTAKLLVKEVDW